MHFFLRQFYFACKGSFCCQSCVYGHCATLRKPLKNECGFDLNPSDVRALGKTSSETTHHCTFKIPPITTRFAGILWSMNSDSMIAQSSSPLANTPRTSSESDCNFFNEVMSYLHQMIMRVNALYSDIFVAYLRLYKTPKVPTKPAFSLPHLG